MSIVSKSLPVGIFLIGMLSFTACKDQDHAAKPEAEKAGSKSAGYGTIFSPAPEAGKGYGYSHAVRIGNDLKISGAVSMDDNGVIVAPGNMEQQMKTVTATWRKF